MKIDLEHNYRINEFIKVEDELSAKAQELLKLKQSNQTELMSINI